MDYAIGYNVGKKRTLNEDFFGVYKANNLEAYVVADGMGGHNAGNIASKIAVRVALEIMEDWEVRRSNPGSQQTKELISKMIRDVNMGVFTYSVVNPTCSGMGTTFVAIIHIGRKVFAAWVGDSRIYGIKGTSLEQISKDDSYVQMLVDLGRITAEEARQHPKKNVITRAIGTESSITSSVMEITEDYDGYLLCSDGLTNMLTDEKIEDKLRQGGFENEEFNLKVICDALVKDANKNGGLDNISLILVRGKK